MLWGAESSPDLYDSGVPVCPSCDREKESRLDSQTAASATDDDLSRINRELTAARTAYLKVKASLGSRRPAGRHCQR